MSYDPLAALLVAETEPFVVEEATSEETLPSAHFLFPDHATQHLENMVRYWRSSPDTELECRLMEGGQREPLGNRGELLEKQKDPPLGKQRDPLRKHQQGSVSLYSFELFSALLQRRGIPWEKEESVCMDFAPLSAKERIRACKSRGEQEYTFEKKETIATLDFVPMGYAGMRVRFSLQRETPLKGTSEPPLFQLRPDVVRFKTRASFPLNEQCRVDLTRRWQKSVVTSPERWATLPSDLNGLQKVVQDTNLEIHKALQASLDASMLEAEIEFRREGFSVNQCDSEVMEEMASALLFLLEVGPRAGESPRLVSGEQIRLRGEVPAE